MLRYGAFRRSRMRRRTLGTAYVIPVFCSRRNADFDIADPEHRRAGCTFVVIPCSISVRGMATKRMLREAGIDVMAFEPYENDGHERISFDRGMVSRGVHSRGTFRKRFTSLSSVVRP